MLRYFILFVLVISMVKTNAQTVYEQLRQTESNDKMLLKIHPGSTMEDLNALLEKIERDPNFSTVSKGTAGYFVLDREPGSTMSKQEALTFYMSEPYVAYASFVFMNEDKTFMGYANDVFVKAKPGVTREQVTAIARNQGLISMLDYRPERNIYQLYFDKYGNTYERSIALFQSGLFVFTEPNFYATTISLASPIGKKTNSIFDCPCVRATSTNDPYMTGLKQWGLYTGDATEYNPQPQPPGVPKYWTINDLTSLPDPNVVPFSDINVCHAWDFNNGSASHVSVDGTGVYVAVIDDGVDTRHDDLNYRMNGATVFGYDPVNVPLVGPPPPFTGNPIYNPVTDPGCPDDNSSSNCFPLYHGTGVAGIISAKRNNTYPSPSTVPMGIAGVAFNSQLMPVHAYWRDVPCALQTTTWQILADALEWSVNNGADVINNSWGAVPYTAAPKIGSALVEDQIQYAVDYGRGGNPGTQTHGKGCVLVFATHNQNYFAIGWPASNPNVIAVGASTMCNERKRAGFTGPNPPYWPSATPSCDGDPGWGSNYGPGMPFVDANNQPLNTSGSISVVAPGVDIASTSAYDTWWDYHPGTSFATPHVSGVAALMLSANPCLEWQEAKTIIEKSADQINPNTPQYVYNTNGITDWNEEMGYGRVNAGDAVTLAYDLYKQATMENSAKTYKSAHHIFAGSNVTNIYKYNGPIFQPANYTVGSSARINFFAPTGNAIHLLPGFEAEYNSNFNAEIIADVCDNHHYHLKQGPENSPGAGMEYFTGKRSNAAREIMIYPNPVNDQLNISFSLAEDEKVTFAVSNMLGQKVSEQLVEDFKAGNHKQTISTSSLVPGVYTITIQTKKGTDQFKFTKQ